MVKKLDKHEQYCKDVQDLEDLAVALSSDGLHAEPADVLRMLLIYGRLDDLAKEDVISIIASKIYPLSDEGSGAVNLFIRRAKRSVGITEKGRANETTRT